MSRLNALLSRWETAAKQHCFAVREKASSIMDFPVSCLQPLRCIPPSEAPQAPRTQPAFILSSPNKPLPPPLLAWLIKLFFRKWSCCAPSSSARGYPGNPLFFTLSSYLPSFPFPIYLIRVGSFLFICRATIFEQLPNCSPASTLQSEKLFITQITSSFQCLTISLKIDSNFFRPSIVQTLAIFHHSLPFFPCLSLSAWKSFIYLKAQDFFFFGFFNWLFNFFTL